MATMTASGPFHGLDNVSHSPPKPSSPASPTAQFSAQQPIAARSHPTVAPNIRGQTVPFPITPTVASQASSFLEPPPGVSYTEFIRTWTDAHVARWLTDIKCGSHAATFKANDIRGDVLLELDQITLKEMGVASVGDRLRIINAVKALRQRSAARVVTPLLDSNRPRPSPEHNQEPQKSAAQDRATPGRPEPSPPTRLSSRTGRPAPLQLLPNVNRGDLPKLEPDSATRPSQTHPVRPLPNPTASQSAHRHNLPPPAPAPTGKPPLPPTSSAARTIARPLNNTGRRTPTQADNSSNYPNQTLSTPSQNRDLLTPSSASNWGAYHGATPTNNTNNGKAAQPRSTSPLPRSSRPNMVNAMHGRNNSLGVASPGPTKLPPRPSTGNGHPYATAQPSLTASQSAQAYNLSPIAESFIGQHSSASSSPSPPSQAYTVGRGPFNPSTPHSNVLPLDALRRKLVKFVLPEEGLSTTIDVATCAGGVEVLEKVLKKFGKGGPRSGDESTDHIQTEDGGLSIDGWGVYIDMGQEDGPGAPLTEAELLAICHSPDHPTREHGLTLRRISRARRHDDRNGSSSPAQGKFLSPGQTSKSTKRASSISILSGLGVRDPERALDPPSPTSGTSSTAVSSAAKRPSKLRNFFGQRPPSELITNHLTEYFPFTEKKLLERTARHSMMRTSTLASVRRSSNSPYNPSLTSRFSSSTQGSQTRTSTSPSRSSFSSLAPPPPPEKPSQYSDTQMDSPSEEIPRMSLSTDDGQSLELHPEDAIENPDPDPALTTAAPPQLLPPIPQSQSLTESLEESIAEHGAPPAPQVLPNPSRRMSYMTELRSKRDRSDTASLMTVDEITAEVENRRASMNVHRESDSDEWTRVDSEGETDDVLAADDEGTAAEDGANEGVLEDEEDEDDEETPKRANKWIKGALIGAGSFGKVYLGMDASSGLLMAVKQVELPTGSSVNQERKKGMLSALEREIELLKNLQHENIVQYLYSSIDDEYLNIFLEYVPGGSVSALLRNYGAFEEPLVKNFVRQILQGLNYLHERDIIHRDIKGANILVDNKGGVKISDFGISKKVDDNLLGGNRANRPSLQGSVFWMAPEVVKQTGHTKKADIWSVGCLVVEMLTGEHPWAQLTQMQAIFRIGSLAKPTIPSDITPEAQDFLEKTFELDHEARPSAAVLLQHVWIVKKPGKGGNAKVAAATDTES